MSVLSLENIHRSFGADRAALRVRNDDVRRRAPANQPDVVQSLEKRRASLNDALTRLMA